VDAFRASWNWPDFENWFDNDAMSETGVFSYQEAELVLALVAPVGTDFDEFVETLSVGLGAFNYKPKLIRLSSLASSFKTEETVVTDSAEYGRLNRLMNAGNAARSHGGDILVLAAASAINGKRSTSADGQKEPLPRTAHIIRSLKHPAEVQTLRRIYGPGFFLIGVVASEDERRDFLKTRKGCSDSEDRDGSSIYFPSDSVRGTL
jgi:hypothetical protein